MNNANDVVIRLGADDSGLPPPVQRTNAAIASIGKTAEVSAGQTAAAMRQLPAQFTDIATQLAGGQNIGLVLLQQGGQIKDSFGGARNALSALSGLITPTSLLIGGLAATVGTLAVASVQGARESSELRDALALSGNAAGLTASRYQTLATQVSAASLQTTSASKEIVLELARSGQVSGSVLTTMATAVARVADVTGEDAKKVAGDFATMTNGVAKWAAEHNKAWNFITLEQYKYIRRLEEQGKAEEAEIYVGQQVIAHLQQQKENLGFVESAWLAVGKAASETWNDIKKIGSDPSELDRLRSALIRKGAAERTQGTPLLTWIFGTPEEAQRDIDTANRDLLRATERAMEGSARALVERQKIAAERAKEGKKPEFPFGAIRDSRQQYQQDFLRSEKAFYVELDKQRQAELTAVAKDPLGDFINEKVLPQAKDRDERRLAQNETYLQALLDANDRAAIELITDERARGEALIELDRQIAQRRAKAAGLEGGALESANGLIDNQAALRRRQLEADLAQATGAQTYQAVYSSISAALQDSSGDPARAFAQTLGRAVFNQVADNLARALTASAVGKDGKGGLLSDLVGIFTGFKYSGTSTDVTAPNYENSFDLMNAPAMATGTNYLPRNMLIRAHEGEAIVPKKYNPAAGGSAGGGPVVVNSSPTINVDARSDATQVAQIAAEASTRAVQALVDELRAQGKL